MRLANSLISLALVMGAAACSTVGLPYGNGPLQAPEERTAANRAMVQSYQQEQIANAIIAQRTIFSYHFMAHTAQLNDLGRRDLGILADHYRVATKDAAGYLSLRQQDASDELYQARVNTVVTYLADRNVDTARVELGDTLAGGQGLASERVVRILTDEYSGDGDSGGSDSATTSLVMNQ
jgi:hypothetical protein